VPPKEAVERVKKQIEKKTEKHLSKITSQTFNNLINNLQDIYENTTSDTDNVVAILKGNKNIQKHLEFLFKNAKKDISIATRNETEKYLNLLENTKHKTKNLDITLLTDKKDTELKTNFNPKNKNLGSRLCIVDDSIVFFPLREEDIHPDYDLGVWVKNEQIVSFFKRLLQVV